MGTYALALNRRSWPLWLLAFLLTLIALWVAYFFRDPERTGARGEQVVGAPANGKVGLIRFGARVDVFLPMTATVRASMDDMTVAGTTAIAELATP